MKGKKSPRETATGTRGGGSKGAARSIGLQVANRQRKPKGSQTALAVPVAAEIREAAAMGVYRLYFGQHAPDPEELATALEHAGTLSLDEASAQAHWADLRIRRNDAWDQVLRGPMEVFQTLFKVAVAHDATIGSKFQTTVVFLRTESEISTRGAATRKGGKLPPGA